MWIKAAPAALARSCSPPAGRSAEKASPFPEPHRPVSPSLVALPQRGHAREPGRVRHRLPPRRRARAHVRRRHRRRRRLLYGPALAPGRAEGPRARRGHRAARRSARSASASSASGSTMSRSGSASPTIRSFPPASFDRIFMIHMYHEIARPSEFLWNLRAGAEARRPGHRRRRRPADRPPRHARSACWSASSTRSATASPASSGCADSESYFAQFEARAPRPAPEQIKVSRPAHPGD